MKVQIQHKVLLELLGKADLARPKRATLPILENVLLEASAGKLAVTCYDLETQVTATGKATVTAKGEIVVTSTLLKFLKGVKGDIVTLETKGQTLKVKVGSLMAAFDCREREDYPPVYPAEGEAIKVKGLAEALAEVTFCAAKEDVRPVLAGVHFRPTDRGARVEAADGFRLAISPLPMGNGAKLAEAFILPRKASEVAARLFKGCVALHIVPRNDEHKDIYFVAEGVTLRAAAVLGTFPDVDRLVPKGGKRITFDTKAMAEAVKAIAPVAKERSPIVRLQARRGAIRVSAKSEDHSVEVEVPMPFKGNAKIALNVRYLKDALARCGAETTVKVKSPSEPAAFRSKSSKTIQVLMPMFVQW